MDEAFERPVGPGPDSLGAASVEEIEQWFAEWEAEQTGAGESGDLDRVVVPALTAVGFVIDDAAAAQFAGNRAMAAQLASLAGVLDMARQNPCIYLTETGLAQRDAIELAERSAATDAGLQLHLSPSQVRNRAYEGRVLAESLPRLWEKFRTGVTGYAQARVAVDLLSGLTDPQAIIRYDTELADKATQLTPSAFRQKARTLKHGLLTEPAELRHTRALAERRVVIEPDEDGMAWIHAYIAASDAVRIKARLDATAKRVAKEQAKTSGGRQRRPQIRADLFAGWLAGDGTVTAARVRPLLFVPLLGLLGQTSPAVQPAVLQGYGPIDPVTAAQLFIDAPAFRRVGTDPFTGEILNFDRRRYRPTKAQRELLAVKFGTCAGKAASVSPSAPTSIT